MQIITVPLTQIATGIHLRYPDSDSTPGAPKTAPAHSQHENTGSTHAGNEPH